MIHIKDRDVLIEVMRAPFHETLIDVLRWIEQYYPGRMTITSGHRNGDPGVHGQIPCRAVDLRSRNYTNPRGLEDHINVAWQYDPVRPDLSVCLLHNIGSGMHFHIQVCDKTYNREGNHVA